MTMNFVNGLKNTSNFTTTTNGAVALKSTHSALVDLFGSIGAMRNRSDYDVKTAFSKAFAEDALLALKMLFYARDIRFGGLGERRVFKVILKDFATIHPDIIKKNIENIPVFGRFDDLYELVGTPVEKDMWTFIKKQWYEDSQNMAMKKPISVMAKWLKSENATSHETIKLALLTAQNLGVSRRIYRKVLSAMRKYIDVTEVKMSAQKWTSINYPAVPSKAMSNYRNAFKKHDESGFEKYIASVSNGEAKINASTLFPYDILEKMCTWGFTIHGVKHDAVLEEQWKALPNYVEGENNVLVMADTSGSMQGRPMATSVGLAIYFAERNHGVFKDVFMTFSSRPSFVQLRGTTLTEKIRCVPEIVENTNLESAFMLILKTAIDNNLNAEDMPKSLVVISDMQFDSAQGYSRSKMTWHDTMVQRFNDAGYEMPNVIYWNVNASKDAFQVTSDYQGVQLASGQSASTFKTILKNIGCNPYEAMVNTLNNPAYDCIRI